MLGGGCPGGVADCGRATGDILGHDGARVDNRSVAYCAARHDDCPGANDAPFADPGIEVNSACEIMGEYHRLHADIGTSADMDARWPCAIYPRAAFDLAARFYVHAP